MKLILPLLALLFSLLTLVTQCKTPDQKKAEKCMDKAEEFYKSAKWSQKVATDFGNQGFNVIEILDLANKQMDSANFYKDSAKYYLHKTTP